MNKDINKTLENPQDLLVTIVKINKNPNFHLDSILTYINIIKEYKTNGKAYRCEWLDTIVLDEIIHIDNKPHNDLKPNEKVGNIITFNPIKVQKVM
jgi:hypothetical protein